MIFQGKVHKLVICPIVPWSASSAKYQTCFPLLVDSRLSILKDTRFTPTLLLPTHVTFHCSLRLAPRCFASTLVIHEIDTTTVTRRNVLERHTDHCSRHQRQLFSRNGRTRLSYSIVGWQRAKTAKHKILISASNFAQRAKTAKHKILISASNFAHCFHILTVY